MGLDGTSWIEQFSFQSNGPLCRGVIFCQHMFLVPFIHLILPSIPLYHCIAASQ